MYKSVPAGFVAAVTGQNVAVLATAAGQLTNVQKVVIQPLPANAAVAYVGTKDMNTTTGVGVIGVIPKPASSSTGPFDGLVLDAPTQLGGMQLGLLYINGATNDKFIVRYI